MGRQLKKASVGTWRSLLFCYNRCITLLFALFCAGFGSAVKAAPIAANVSTIIIKGKAQKYPGNTPLKNIKLYLCDVQRPLYGVSACTYFRALDSTVTTSDGSFEFNYNTIRNPLNIAFSMLDSTNLSKVQRYASEDIYLRNQPQDTTLTVLLKPFVCTGIIENEQHTIHETISVHYGQNIIIKVPESIRFQIQSAVLLSLKGEKIGFADILSTGTLSLDTKKLVPGMYILSITNNKSKLLQRILIK